MIIAEQKPLDEIKGLLAEAETADAVDELVRRTQELVHGVGAGKTA